MWPFNKKEKQRIAELESTIESYRNDNQYLRDENKRLEQFELKVKIMEMYINDDDAILELLDIELKKQREKDNYLQLLENQRNALYQSQDAAMRAAQSGRSYGTGLGVLGGTGLFGSIF